MPTISGRTSVAFGASVANVLLGSQYELAPFDGTIEIGMLASAPLCDAAIFSGPDVLQEPGGFIPFPPGATAAVPIEAAPKYPDDYHWEDEVAEGDRLKITLHNGNTAGTAIVTWAVRISPA